MAMDRSAAQPTLQWSLAREMASWEHLVRNLREYTARYLDDAVPAALRHNESVLARVPHVGQTPTLAEAQFEVMLARNVERRSPGMSAYETAAGRWLADPRIGVALARLLVLPVAVSIVPQTEKRKADAEPFQVDWDPENLLELGYGAEYNDLAHRYSQPIDAANIAVSAPVDAPEHDLFDPYDFDLDDDVRSPWDPVIPDAKPPATLSPEEHLEKKAAHQKAWMDEHLPALVWSFAGDRPARIKALNVLLDNLPAGITNDPFYPREYLHYSAMAQFDDDGEDHLYDDDDRLHTQLLSATATEAMADIDPVKPIALWNKYSVRHSGATRAYVRAMRCVWLYRLALYLHRAASFSYARVLGNVYYDGIVQGFFAHNLPATPDDRIDVITTTLTLVRPLVSYTLALRIFARYLASSRAPDVTVAGANLAEWPSVPGDLAFTRMYILSIEKGTYLPTANPETALKLISASQLHPPMATFGMEAERIGGLVDEYTKYPLSANVGTKRGQNALTNWKNNMEKAVKRLRIKAM